MSSRTNFPTPEIIADQTGIEERRALIERVAASEQFRRSVRLRDFLLYVGGQSLKEGFPDIHEQEIGVKVFGRSQAYDRSQDNIVRVNATELRKRIELYFTTEGADEPLVFEIPRGGYKLIFHPRSVATSPPAPEVAESKTAELPTLLATPVESSRSRTPWWNVAFVTLSLALAIIAAYLFHQNQALRKTLFPWEDEPAVAALWTDFVQQSHKETDIVLPDAAVSLSEDMIGHPMSLSEYLNHNFAQRLESLDLSPDRRADLNKVFAHNLVTFGDFNAAQDILALSPIANSLHLTLSRFYTADSIKRNNVILIGGKKANPWVGLFDDQMNFSLDFDNEHSRAFIVNRHPKAGEQSIYAATSDPNAFVGYSVIAYLPNPSKSGHALILAGTDSDATGAAAEFLTSEEHMEKLQSTLHVRNFPSFEILLKASRLSGTSFSAEVLAYRTYPDATK